MARLEAAERGSRADVQEKACIEAEDADVDVVREALTAVETAESAEVPRQRAELAQKHGVGMDLSQAQQLE